MTRRYHLNRIVHRMLGECIHEARLRNIGLSINEEYLSYLRFAGDIVFLSESAEDHKKCLKNYKQTLQSGAKDKYE